MSFSGIDRASTVVGSPVKNGDGDSAYMADSQKVQNSVKRMLEKAAEIGKEASKLGGKSDAASKQKAQDSFKSAKESMQAARLILEKFPVNGGNAAETKTRSLTKQKLADNLIRASKAVEAAYRAFQSQAAKHEAEAKAAEAAAAAATQPGGSRPGIADVEMGAVDSTRNGEAGAAPQQELQLEASQAEVETHAAIVDEFVEEIGKLGAEVQQLQRCMVDLAEHTQSSGLVLDNIERNMHQASEETGGATEQLVQASERHRQGTKVVLWLLFSAFLLAALIVIIAAYKGR